MGTQNATVLFDSSILKVSYLYSIQLHIYKYDRLSQTVEQTRENQTIVWSTLWHDFVHNVLVCSQRLVIMYSKSTSFINKQAKGLNAKQKQRALSFTMIK